ncbi:hypothetical protein M3212_20935 [Alkalihalobacillus oceani]|uniref:hypothetical protein n=1 Tax=Halalkalibacter oceani TaxID=1653776 RepID=UPI00203FB761|nr:hypothetical protein [Halalkalibacter oceani]MCM3763182.1 hypothetical protein [Halalkalibacter oceani]
MRKWLMAIAGLIGLAVGIVIWMNQTYFYTPFSYPDGVVAEHTYSFKDFKRPVSIYVEKRDFSSSETPYLYSKRMTDTEVVRELLGHLDRAKEVEDMINPDAVYDESNIHYRIFVLGNLYEGRDRQLFVMRYGEGQDSFHIESNRYFELTPEFKDSLNQFYQMVEWRPWP